MSSFSELVRSGRPLVIAHRGANHLAPENTLSAFSAARAQGADGIELDVKLTADGEVVVLHDQTLDRTTDGHGPLRKARLAELRRLDAGGWFGPSFAGEPIPTLDAVFETFKDTLLYDVELTNYTTPFDGLLKAVQSLIRRHNLASMVFVSSFFPTNISRFRRLEPSIPGGLIALAGLAGLPSRSRLGRWFSPGMVIPVFRDLTADYIQAQKDGHRLVIPWTVNEPADMQRLVDWGVSGFITDDPGLARKTVG